jgi:hypothetical protein
MSHQLRSMFLAVVIAFLPSCYRWQDYGPKPQAALQAQPRSALHVSRVGGTAVELRNAGVIEDSLVGEGIAPRTGAPGPRIVIPFSQVERVRTRRLNGGKTAVLIGGVVAGALLVPAAIYVLTYEDQSSHSHCAQAAAVTRASHSEVPVPRCFHPRHLGRGRHTAPIPALADTRHRSCARLQERRPVEPGTHLFCPLRHPTPPRNVGTPP